ncbi:MAG: helix-turn-helix domain-containing protein [Syntrophobacteraceae bacterium]
MTRSYKRIGAVKTAFEILEYLSIQHGLVNAKQIATELRMPYGTVMTHMATLLDGGYVSQVGDGFKIGTRMSLFWLRMREMAESRRMTIEQALSVLGGI